jgi:uncharacterized membrane protein YdjX (TVP38/TMEM64 family)
MEHYLTYLQQVLFSYPLVAPIIFIIINILIAVFFLPCSPMTLMAGVLWGGVSGFLISMIASILASATTFYLSRSFFQNRIASFIQRRYPKVSELLIQIANHDWKIIGLTQINPLMPASTLGYVFGLSEIKFSRYIICSAIFMIPLQLLFVMTGHSVISLIASGNHLGLVLSLIALIVIIHLCGKSIYKKLCCLIGVKNGS